MRSRSAPASSHRSYDKPDDLYPCHSTTRKRHAQPPSYSNHHLLVLCPHSSRRYIYGGYEWCLSLFSHYTNHGRHSTSELRSRAHLRNRAHQRYDLRQTAPFEASFICQIDAARAHMTSSRVVWPVSYVETHNHKGTCFFRCIHVCTQETDKNTDAY